LQGGIVVKEGRWQPNLILDRGLDILATIPICDYFKVCAKGTGTGATSEDVADTNTYSQTGPDLTLTRTAGTRDFTSADVGKLIQFDSSTKVLCQDRRLHRRHPRRDGSREHLRQQARHHLSTWNRIGRMPPSKG
jgi:hypothetical protein